MRTTSRWISTKNFEIETWSGLYFFVYQLNPGTIQYHIILFDSSVILCSGFHNPIYLEIYKFLDQFLASKFQNISIENFKTSWSSCFFFFYKVDSMPRIFGFKNVSLLHLKQELQEVLKFPIEIFWYLEASLISELLYF